MKVGSAVKWKMFFFVNDMTFESNYLTSADAASINKIIRNFY